MAAGSLSRRPWLLPVVVALHLVCFALLLFLVPDASTLGLLVSLSLMMFAALTYGRLPGLVSGIGFALVRMVVLLGGSYTLAASTWNALAAIPVQDLAVPVLLPAAGFLAGLYAESCGLVHGRLERQVRDLQADNRQLSDRLERLDRDMKGLSATKVYRRAWDAWVDERNLNEPIVGLLLSTLTETSLALVPREDRLSLAIHWERHSNRVLFDLLARMRPEILAILDPDGRILQTNPVLTALLGFPAGTPPVGTPLTDLLHPDDRIRAADNLGLSLTSDLRRDESYRILAPDGCLASNLLAPTLTLDCGGDPLTRLVRIGRPPVLAGGYGGSRILAEPDSLAELARTPFCRLGPDFRIRSISPEIPALLGETVESMTGRTLDRFLSRRDTPRFSDCTALCREGRFASLELEMRPHLGIRTFLLMEFYPSRGDDGACLGATLLLKDVTDVKKVEEALQHRLGMETLISNISTRFISLKAEELDREIEGALREIGAFEEAEESHVEIHPSRRVRNPAVYTVRKADRLQEASGSGLAGSPLSAPLSGEAMDAFETVSIPIVIDAEVLGFFRFYQKQGVNSWFEADLELIRLIGEIIFNALIRKENELDIRLNENRLATTLHSIGDAVIATDPRGGVVLMNRTAETLTGWNREAALGQPLERVFAPVPEAADDGALPDETVDGEVLPESKGASVLHATDGRQYYVSVTRSRIEDDRSEIFGEVIVFRDVTKEKLEVDEIRYISYHDRLTGLYNRAFFEEELARLNTRRQYPITLILGDCNGLKICNDIFGHFEGDRLLQTVAGILKGATRHEDIVARWGGDEFAIILPRTDEQAGASVRERILACCTEAPADPIQPSLALGSATNTDGSSDLMALLKLAEDRMYRHKLMEGKSARNVILQSIEKMIYEKSCETEEHASRMREFAGRLGRAVGLDDYELEELSLLSVLHDIGKIGIPDSILMKPGRLDPEEWEVMKKHSEKGYNLAKSTPELTVIADSILHHHERWDGTGYPAGLKGEQIPVLSRILAIIDTFDVITHARAYKPAQSKEEALREIERCAGTQFDPALVRQFVAIMRD